VERASLRILLGGLAVVSALAGASCAGSDFADGGAGGTGATSTTSSSGGGAAGGTTSSTTDTTSTATSTASTTTGAGGGGAGAGGDGGAGGSGAGGGPVGVPCTWANGSNPCAAGRYCNAPGCGQGTCEPLPVLENKAKVPVCGCDDVTYWNESIAASHGASVASAGQCQAPKSCGGFANLQCPASTFCNHAGADSSVCKISDAGGVCWGMPAVCPAIPASAFEHRACSGGMCADECTLVKSGDAFYHDTACAP
jgi:hypothetical protein